MSIPRFQPGINIGILLQVSQKYFYYFETDYLFLFCLAKTKDKKKGYILVNKFIVQFTNREKISIEQNLSIKMCKKAYTSVDSSYDNG